MSGDGAAAAGVRVRPATEADVPSLLEMIHELARNQGEERHVATNEDTLRRDGFGDAPRFHALIAEFEDRPVGYITYTLSYSIWGGRPFVMVDDLFVREGFRGRGVGRALMQPIEALAESRGTYARWTVQPGNERAIAFYRSLGAAVVTKGVCYWNLDGSA